MFWETSALIQYGMIYQSLKFALPSGRTEVGVCAVRGQIYAVGGSDSWNCYNSVEVYQPEEDCWRTIAPMKTCRRGAGTCTLEGKPISENFYLLHLASPPVPVTPKSTTGAISH